MTPGFIYKLSIPEFADHQKYIVIAAHHAKSGDVLIFFINSRINAGIYRDEDDAQYHLPLLKDDYSFLSYNSYLDCALPQELSAERIAQSVRLEQAEVIGTIKDEHLNLALEMVQKSRFVTKKLLKKYGLL